MQPYELTWNEVQPGVWKTTIGRPEPLTPLSVLGIKPRTEALRQMPEAAFPLAEASSEGSSRRALLRVPLTPEEKLYGLGLHFMRMNHRGRTRYLRVNSDPKQDTGETHAPVPFIVSDRGYGVLIDTSRIVTVYCGSSMKEKETAPEQAIDRNNDRSRWKATPVSETMEWLLPAEGADVYVFGGSTPLEVVRRYNLFNGGGTLPPRWGLGFWHRVPTLYSGDQVKEEALEFRRRGFPCDVIGLEPGWHSKSYPVTYEWNKERFPEPAAFVKEMADEGFRINLWEHPYVSPEAAVYEPLRPLSGTYSVWAGLAPDYTLEEARNIYQRLHREAHVSIGVSGYKLDECDGSELTNNSWMFPAHAEFPSGADGEQMRQLYGLLFQRMTAQLYENDNQRTYGLVRASGTGASNLPYVLYSDLYDHRQFVRALCNASFSGLLWTPEVRKAASAEDWVRRMQSVCFSPMAMLNAWGDGTKPWSFPEVEHIVRHYIRLRMRLLPYLYTAFARYYEDGTPPFRAMPLAGSGYSSGAEKGQAQEKKLDTVEAAYGGTRKREWDDQFLVGDDLLVAPLFAGETESDVILPEGRWYGLETGEAFEGGSVVRVAPGLEHIPVFVRDGAILPMTAAADHAPKPGEQVPLILCHFGQSGGEAHLYDDDGRTQEYREGRRIWRKAVVKQGADGNWTGELSSHDAAFPSTFGEVEWRFGLTQLPSF
ncbi:ABC transporter substrate-binding protein [Paenibacillus filicis]|uniref:ABC transporter substrate-binding protein n=1 Tax=Paenibacillus gyeongsangnamensis TaxID=3388067 RepID=A0ABT4Q2F8_9BACL|nr:TIM-barrel domain-containing protein [Paenibacillus filicis]MCZ8511065.1 ABC transporter substrate-binding protein [Paenibacillus filicis]